jgi:hypothetical protein
MMMATAAQAAEPEKIYVHTNSVTIWESPEPFKHVFVGSASDKEKDDKDLITAFTANELGNRRLVISVRQPSENLFGFGEGIIAQGNVLLYDETGKEVAHLIVEVTPLNGPSNRINIVRARELGPPSIQRLQCTDRDCTLAFKPREASAVETRPDGTVRREYK